jgi:transposase
MPLVPLSGNLFGRGLRLLHDSESRQYGLFLGGTVLDTWAAGDVENQRLVTARLVRTKLASATEVAQVFGVHRNTVARITRQVEAEGAAGAFRQKPGPHHPSKVTPEVQAELERAIDLGLNASAAQCAVEQRLGVRLSLGHVRRILRRMTRQRAEQGALDLSGTAPAASATSPADEPALPDEGGPNELLAPPLGVPERPGATVHSRYLGLTLFYPALQAVGLLSVAEQVYQLPGAVLFGVRQVFLQLFCLALLQEPTIERAKRVVRADLGVVVGRLRAACVKTLRRKLAAVVKQGRALELGQALARHWLEVGLLNTSYLYVDGHMKVYSGKRHLAEVWNSQRRMPLPGIEQYFVNDLQGRPLLVVSQEVSGNLAKSLPTVIAAVREVVGQRRFTVIFDRGGYAGQLFTWLVEQQVDFITYQRGSVALAADQFRRREVRWEGRRVRFWLAEDSVSVQGSGPWRRIVIRTADGHQTPILTSLGQAVPAARVAALMIARWRQENFFKYAKAHLGLDALVSSAAEEAPDLEVPNPALKAAKLDLKRLRASAQKLRAALGQTLVLEAQPADPDTDAAKPQRAKRSPTVTRDTVLAQLEPLETELEQARGRLRALPKRVLLSSLKQSRETMQLEAKLVADAVRLAAYNAQVWLADRLAAHYANPFDRHDLLRSFAQLSGTMTRQPDGHVSIRIDPPDTPLYRRALEGLCQDLNRSNPVFPGTAAPVHYEVAMHHFS